MIRSALSSYLPIFYILICHLYPAGRCRLFALPGLKCWCFGRTYPQTIEQKVKIILQQFVGKTSRTIYGKGFNSRRDLMSPCCRRCLSIRNFRGCSACRRFPGLTAPARARLRPLSWISPTTLRKLLRRLYFRFSRLG